MVNRTQFYIDGAWVDPAVKKTIPVINPANEDKLYDVAVGSAADVDKAVAAARKAFETFSQTSREERIALLTKIIDIYKKRAPDMAALISDEMGAPACARSAIGSGAPIS
ncbi:MAG: aldehyde dehydrogenase family protein, partial [Alcaligenaceae bacterium]